MSHIEEIIVTTHYPMFTGTQALIDAAKKKIATTVIDPGTDPLPVHSEQTLVLHRRGGRMEGSQRAQAWIGSAPVISDPLQAYMVATDKWHQAALCKQVGILHPHTILVDPATPEEQVREELGPPPWILKPCSGGRSLDVQLVQSWQEAVLHYYRIGRACILQE